MNSWTLLFQVNPPDILILSGVYSVCFTVFISPDVIILQANFRLLRKLPADLRRFCEDFLKADDSLKSESQSVRKGLSTEWAQNKYSVQRASVAEDVRYVGYIIEVIKNGEIQTTRRIVRKMDVILILINVALSSGISRWERPDFTML